MNKPVFCSDCAARAPDAETSYTVIGAGWRLSKRETPEGICVEWRCKDCWRKHKGEAASASSGRFPIASRARPSGNGTGNG